MEGYGIPTRQRDEGQLSADGRVGAKSVAGFGTLLSQTGSDMTLPFCGRGQPGA